MNRIYRLVRNRATGEWVVASELAKGRRKLARKSLPTLAALLVTHTAGAATLAIPDFDPESCDFQACSAQISGGANVTLTGTGTQFGASQTGQTVRGVSDPIFQSKITAGAEYADPANPASLVVNTGALNNLVEVPDASTGGTKYVATYSNSAITDTYARSAGANYIGVVWNEVGDQQYVDTRIANVDSSGGTVNVEIGSGTATKTASNSIVLNAKQSVLARADGTAGNASAINWNSSNFVNLGSPLLQAELVQSKSFTFSAYTGTFAAYDGSSRSVSSDAELKDYNTWLIAELGAGRLDPALYVAEFKKAYTDTTRTITWEHTVTDPSDDVYQPMGDRIVIHADGASATGTVAAGAHLDVDGASTSEAGKKGAVMLATNQATVTNEGTIGFGGAGSGGNSYGSGLWADGLGSTAVNNGVLAVSYWTGGGDRAGAESANPVNPTVYGVYNRGLHATGGATVVNNGIVNVGGSWSQGFWVNNGTALNTGVVNVGVNTTGDGDWLTSYTNVGALVVNGQFTNDGEIYLGRGAQYDAADTPADIGNNLKPLVGIQVTNGGGAVNNGLITLGSQTHNSAGMIAEATPGQVVNRGTIKLAGDSDLPAQNVGVWAKRSRNVANEGTIEVLGTNGVGLKVTEGGEAANRGRIVLSGGVSSLGLHNYGVLAEGAGSKATLDGGSVDLSGNGAVGVLADNGGIVSVGGEVNFVSGSDQIGYFARGAGSTVDITGVPAAGLDVSTEGSTLFRIEDGASISNTAGAGLTASGRNSTAVQVTGAGSTMDVDTLGLTLTGAGATGIKLQGGATGSMSDASRMTLGDNTTAIALDNVKYDINGDAVGSAQTTFTNTSDIVVAGAVGATVFSVNNGARLLNSGDITLANGTAIELAGAGSSFGNPSATGAPTRLTVSDGNAAIHVRDGATLSSREHITVDGTAAGIRVAADAGFVEVTSDAHILGQGAAYGNLVVNEGDAANVRVSGATLEMQGSGAALLANHNLDPASHGEIVVSGTSAGKGIALSLDDGSQAADDLVLGDNWNISVTGNGSGVYANTTGNLTLDGTSIVVSGDGNAVRSVASNAVTVNAGSVLRGTSADARLVAGDMAALINEGEIAAADANAVAVQTGSGDTTFMNTGAGKITGAVDLGDGDDSALLADSSILDGSLYAGRGDDMVVVSGDSVTFGVIDGGAGGDDLLVFIDHAYTADAGNADQLKNFEQVELALGSTLSLERDFAVTDTIGGRGLLAINGGSVVSSAGSRSIDANVDNQGLITLANGLAGDTLTITGDYVGNGGTVELDTVLGADDSATDKLVIQGDASGHSLLKLNGLTDADAYTSADGIQVVQVDGASDGTFVLSGRVVAGAREYLLAQGGKANPADGDWYLRSELPVPPVVVPDPDPEAPVVEPEPETPVVVEPEPETPIVVEPEPPVVTPPEPESELPPVAPQPDPTPVYRPEPGAYLANQAAAIGMFQHSLHDRLGEVDFDERKRQEGSARGAVWSRATRDQLDGTTGANQVDLGTHSDLLQVGAEVGGWTAGGNRWQVGGMASVGRASSRAESNVTGYATEGRVRAQMLGAYATWRADAASGQGLYVDGWVQGGRFKNTVHGESLARERYDAKGAAASVEAGYAFAVGRGRANTYYLQPHLQIIASDYQADDHVEANGTLVRTDQGKQLTTRVGARFHGRPDAASANRVQPFVEANWLRQGKDPSITLDGEKEVLGMSKNTYELKVGAEVELGRGWTGWGHMRLAEGDGDSRHVGGQVGVKYGW